MENLEVISTEEHIIENKKCLLIGLERKHSYEKLTNAEVTFTVKEEVMLNITKGKINKNYKLNIDKSLLDNVEEFMVIEISKKHGNINYIAIKK